MSARPQPDNLPLPPLPAMRYPCVGFDPPWHFYSRAKSANPESVRHPQRHYPTMSLDAIAAIPMRSILAPDALLFMWITGPMITEGAHVRLFKEWGLRPSAMAFVWIKLKRRFDSTLLHRTPLLEADLHCSTAFTTLQNAEYCLLARRGSVPRTSRIVRQVIIESVRAHSRKPESFYRRVEAYCPGPRLDMFGGRPREGWDYWGHPHWTGDGE